MANRRPNASKMEKLDGVPPIYIHTSDLSRDKSLPEYPINGMIFTARIPPSIAGGKYSALKLGPRERIFDGYSAIVIPGKREDKDNVPHLITDEVLRTVREGDLCRFIVYDRALTTAHPPSERNWFAALMLRPIYGERLGIGFPKNFDHANFARADLGEQVLLEPQETRALLDAIIEEKQMIPIGKGREVLHNDWLWLNTSYKQNPETIKLLKEQIS